MKFFTHKPCYMNSPSIYKLYGLSLKLGAKNTIESSVAKKPKYFPNIYHCEYLVNQEILCVTFQRKNRSEKHNKFSEFLGDNKLLCDKIPIAEEKPLSHERQQELRSCTLTNDFPS